LTTISKRLNYLGGISRCPKDFNPKAANQVWSGDITYLRTHEGWLYLAMVMDLYSRRIIGWAMDKYISADLVK